YADPRTTMRKARFEPGRSVKSRMSSNSVTPKVSFRPRVTAALLSCGIISSDDDITRVSGRGPDLSLFYIHLYLACFLCIRLPGRGTVILKTEGVDVPSKDKLHGELHDPRIASGLNLSEGSTV